MNVALYEQEVWPDSNVRHVMWRKVHVYVEYWRIITHTHTHNIAGSLPSLRQQATGSAAYKTNVFIVLLEDSNQIR